MTNPRKTAKAKPAKKRSKLQLNKDTIKDLSARGAGKVKGGQKKAGLSVELGCE